MAKELRQSMSWLHTWAGILLSGLIFAVFWMGTLSVFDREIDRWMMPDTRLELPKQWSLNASLMPTIQRLTTQAHIRQWGVTLPDERTPYLRLFYQTASGEFINERLDVTTGELIPDPGTLGATGFIFPFHYRLNIPWAGLGYWLVGLAAMAMMVLLVSGVLIHKKIFKEFFTFRPQKRLQRVSLDLHNLTGVAALPFHFLITLSGLIIFSSIYFPNAAELAYADTRHPSTTFFAESGDAFQRPASGHSTSQQASLDDMVKRAQSHWRDAVGFIRVRNVGDTQSVVQLGRTIKHEVSWNIDKLYFDAVNGKLLHEATAKPLMGIQRFFVGLHFIQFQHGALRWLYFIAGVGSCIMIGTGFIFWSQARRKRHARQQLAGVRIVDTMAIGSVSGIILATVAFWLANRILPADAVLASAKRADLEVWVFYLIWLCSFVHAALCTQSALKQQCASIAVLALTAVLANGLTTGDSLWSGHAPSLAAVAGMNASLIIGAIIAAVIAIKLHRRQKLPVIATARGHYA